MALTAALMLIGPLRTSFSNGPFLVGAAVAIGTARTMAALQPCPTEAGEGRFQALAIVTLDYPAVAHRRCRITETYTLGKCLMCGEAIG